MADIYLIGATIRFTAEIKTIAGVAYDPNVITVSVYSEDTTKLLDGATPTKEETGSYYYDWKVAGIIQKSDLIVVWDWSGDNKKRMKFKVLLETD